MVVVVAERGRKEKKSGCGWEVAYKLSPREHVFFRDDNDDDCASRFSFFFFFCVRVFFVLFSRFLKGVMMMMRWRRVRERVSSRSGLGELDWVGLGEDTKKKIKIKMR